MRKIRAKCLVVGKYIRKDIIVLGDSATGKTALLSMLLNKG